ncbi:MAG: DUF192 domain-containing protein [Patescibacteria group bacterium]
MNKKIIIIVVCLLLIFIAARHYFYKTGENLTEFFGDQVILDLEGVKVKAEVVKSPEDLARGLSFRESLEKDRGMLFVFENLDYYSFWMKDMKFSLDIIWLDKNFSVVHIEKFVKPETFPNSFKPNVLSKYVLEVNAGFSDENKIEIGSYAQIQR